MDTLISFTPAQLVAICAGLLTLIALAEKAISIWKKSKEPILTQSEKLDEIDERLDVNRAKINRNEREIDELRKSNKILQRGVYELLGNAIEGGNNKDAMRQARELLKRDIFEQ